MKSKKYLFYLGHPAHYHMFKNLIRMLISSGDRVVIVIKKKDILEDLLNREGIEYYNILTKERGRSRLATLFAMIEKDIELFRITKSEKPDILIGSAVEVAHVGRITGTKSLIFGEDDYYYIKEFILLGYTFANHIVTPAKCKTGLFIYKNLRYDSYQKMAYLHPKYFKPDRSKLGEIEEKYFIIRRTKLAAYHDRGLIGLNDKILRILINKLNPFGKVYLSAEGPDLGEFESYRLLTPIESIHHALYYSTMLISDSQSMTVEAAILGVPSIRFSDFSGKISVLEELEHEYEVTWGIKPNEIDRLEKTIDLILSKIALDTEFFKKASARILQKKIDTTEYFYWLIKSFPNSIISQGSRIADQLFLEGESNAKA